MNRLSLFVFILASIAVWGETERSLVGDKLIRLEPLNEEHVKYIQDLEINSSLDFWTDTIHVNGEVDIRIQRDVFDQYASQFRQLSLPFEILIDDLQKTVDDEKQQIEEELFKRQLKNRLFGEFKADILGLYVGYNEMTQFLDEKAADDPAHLKVVNIGTTVEGRTIKGISIQFNPASKRNVWFDCGIHAREWITPAACIWLVGKFIEEYNANDPTTKEILDHWTVYIAPSLNPDGYEYTRSAPANRYWRKSRSRPTSGNCYGVDLNRNYPRNWMTGGSSSSPCSDTFAGSAAGSEIETKGVLNFLTSKLGTWDLYMSFHSYGQWWFTPYGYNTSLPANYAEQYRVAVAGAEAIKSITPGRTYELGSVARLLYVASGSTVDWAYDTLQIPYSYTVELPPKSAAGISGFNLPVAQAPGVCIETYAAMKTILSEIKDKSATKLHG